MRIGKIASTQNISVHPNHSGKLGRRPRKPFSFSDLLLRCRNYAGWHPFTTGLCLAIATSVLLTGLTALVAIAMPVLGGWAICTPENGVVLALLLLTRRKHWLWILLGYALALWQGGRVIAPSVHPGALEIFGNVAEVSLAALALPPFRSLKQWLQEPRLLPAFLAYAIVLGPLLMSLSVARGHSTVFDLHASLWSRVSHVALAEAIGMALATSLVLVLLNRETYSLFRLGALPQTLALLGLAGLSTWLAFHGASSMVALLAVITVLIIIVFRLGLRAAVLGLALDAVVAIASRFHASGDLSPAATQALLALSVIIVLPLSVTLARKQFLEERLNDAKGELDRLKSLDRLTGVPNRKRFDLVLEREWQRATRDPKPVALLMVDVDDFDLYQQHYGPGSGDECLRRVAERMADKPQRAYDLISRYDGSKFSVLLPGASGEAVERIAEQFRAEIAAQEWPHERSSFERVTVSVGWASMIPKPQSKPDALIAAADSALRLARENGKNRVEGINDNSNLADPDPAVVVPA